MRRKNEVKKIVEHLISEAESLVMKELWNSAPQGSSDIVESLHDNMNWHENTVRTLLTRLVGKGVVRAERKGRRYLYSPTLTRVEWQTYEVQRLLSRVFDGQAALLVLHVICTEIDPAKDAAT